MALPAKPFPRPDWVGVSSSWISRVAYTPTHGLSIGTLFVETRGKQYAYSNVPETTYKAMLAAPSQGQFFGQFIRDRYGAVRVA